MGTHIFKVQRRFGNSAFLFSDIYTRLCLTFDAYDWFDFPRGESCVLNADVTFE